MKEFLSKLRERGQLARTPDGDEAVPVSLMCQVPLKAGSRAGRKDELHAFFARLGDEFGHELAMNPQSLSVTGQTVEALIPVDTFKRTVDSLASRQVRVDILIDRHVI